MRVSIRECVSSRRLERAWKALKEGLDGVHFAEFLLQIPHSEVLALLVTVIASPQRWLVGALIAAGWTWCFRKRPWEEVAPVNDNVEKEQDCPIPEPPLGELTFATPSVQNLLDLAKQGIGVKITIELKPAR